MKRYKVLKEFVDRGGALCGRGARNAISVDESSLDDEYLMFYQMLENEGYIGAIEDGVWSRGIKIPANTPFWKLRTRGDAVVDCANGAELYDVAFGLAFRTKEEAEAYANHLRLENVLINIAVRDYGADPKLNDQCPVHMSPEVEIGEDIYFYFEHVFFRDRDLAEHFVRRNMDALRNYFSYYFEEEKCQS